MNENVAEGAQVVAEAPAVEKKPDSVSMSDYIGVKEMLRKSEGNLTALQGKLGEALSTSETSVAKVKELEEQVSSLNEQAVSSKATSVDPAELEKVMKESGFVGLPSEDDMRRWLETGEAPRK